MVWINILVSIPAFNEEGTIKETINQVKDALKGTNFSILVLDDGSTDNTASIARQTGARVFSHTRNHGLAETFRTEMDEALKLNPDIIVHFDADLQYNPKEILSLVKEVQKGNDLVLGSRFAGRIESMPLIKKLGNKAFSRVVSCVTHFKVTDAQTGFRAFTKEVASLVIRSNHTYTQEQIIVALKSNFVVKEVPVTFSKRADKSRLISSPFEYALKAGINLMRVYRDFAPLKFFGLIGGFLFSVGFLIGLWFVFLHFTSGITGHLGLMVLMILLLLVGLQVVLFGFLADMNLRK